MAGPIGFAELARLLEVSTAAATGVGDRLEGHGHAVRRAHASDRRRVELHVTDSGREQLLARCYVEVRRRAGEYPSSGLRALPWVLALVARA